MKWAVSIIKVANAGVHKEVRITCAMPQEHGKEFVKQCWPTEDHPVFAELELTEELKAESPAHAHTLNSKPSEHVPPAGVHNPYSRRAGILATNKAFHRFASIDGVPDPSSYAASYIRLICGVKSRKDILPGSVAAEKFDKLSTDFAIWNEGPRHGL